MIARELAAHPRFEWLPGMLVCADAANPPARMVYRDDDEGHTFAVAERVQMLGRDPGVDAWSDDAYSGEEVPDLADPATAGVLLAELLDLDPSLHIHRDGDGYLVHVAPGVCEYVGATLGEAVARALLAVWGPW